MLNDLAFRSEIIAANSNELSPTVFVKHRIACWLRYAPKWRMPAPGRASQYLIWGEMLSEPSSLPET
jgi:hypothetical protein